ncbi:MAG: PAS domain S-box protein [Spirochaetota bacterium]
MKEKQTKKTGVKRRSSLQSLQMSEERLALALEATGNALFDYNAKSGVFYLSPELCAMIGYGPDELSSSFDSLISLVHPDDKESLANIFLQYNENLRDKHEIKIRIKTKKGKWRWILSRGIIVSRDRKKRALRIVGTHADITEFQEAEKISGENEERFKVISRTINEMIYDWDLDSRTAWLSEAYQALFGYSENYVKYNWWFDKIHPDDRELVNSDITELFEGNKQKMSFEYRFLKADGSYAYILDSAFLLRDIKGNPSRIIGAMMDITGLKQAENALRRSEATLRSIISTAPVGISLLSKDRKLLWVNDRNATIAGFTLKELSKDVRQMYLNEEEYIRVGEVIYNEVWKGNIGETDTKWIHKDGRVLDIHLSVAAIDPNDRSAGVVFITQDITERKRVEESLKASEERFKQLVESVTDYIYTVKIENGRPVATTHSPGCITVTGYSSNEYENNPLLWYNMIYEEDKESVLKQTAAVLSGKTAEPLEHRIIHKNSNVRWVRNTPVPRFENGKLCAYDGLISDITERKHAEEALRISEEKYRDIFERSVEGIFQSSPQGKFLNVNPSLALIFGYESPEEMIATIEDIGNQVYVYSDERLKFKAAIEESGKVVGFKHLAYRKDKSKIWISLNVRIVRDDRGKMLYYEGTALDITRQKHIEEEREKLQSQLRQAQKMEAIGTFVGGIAHDFNNILSVILGYGSLLQMGISNDDPMHKYVDLIVTTSEKAANLTKGLLAFSRKQPVDLKPVNLNEIIIGTKGLLKRLITDDIILAENFTTDNTTIMGDVSQIDQVLFNLATNAKDAMPNGGTLTLETRCIELDEDFSYILKSGKAGKYVLLSFSDTGTGIDKDIREHIFDPFFTTKEVGKGTGLGLSTVYGIINQHGGHINIYSEPGIGTTFHIYFPALGANVERENLPASEIREGKETILLAEDNDNVRQLLKTVLEAHGYSIIEAVDGEDAIMKFKNNKNIDLCIIDSVMPKKNGRQVYDEVIKIKPDIKVLFTSGYTRDIVLDKGIEEKEFNFLSKPLMPNELLQKVGEILDNK